MIEYIHIKNFQSHVDSRIDFSSRTTAVTGLSMNGKTAIKRAFEWLRKNRPSGFRFNYRYGDKPTEVEIGIDGHILRLSKGDKTLDDDGNKAIYYIKYPDGSEVEEKAFGTSVPDSVTALLGISDISIQDQLDAYLLVISSAGEIARTINRITGVDVGDRWLKDINRNITSINRSISRISGEIDFLEEDVNKYDGIDDLKEITERAKILQANRDTKAEFSDQLVDIINTHNAAVRWLEENKAFLSPLLKLKQEYDSLSSELTRINEQRELSVNILTLWEGKEEFVSAINFLQPELQKFKDFFEFKKKLTELKQLVSKYDTTNSLIEPAKQELQRNKESLANYLLKIRVCYVCGGEFDDFDKIMRSI